MYEEVGHYSGDLKKILSLVSDLDFKHSVTGYEATNATHNDIIIERLNPILKDTLVGKWEGVMITKILPNGILPMHQDGALPGKRYHLVLESNPLSWCMHGGEWQHLDVGGIYTMNPTEIHGSINWGNSPRTHLVVDVV